MTSWGVKHNSVHCFSDSTIGDDELCIIGRAVPYAVFTRRAEQSSVGTGRQLYLDCKLRRFTVAYLLFSIAAVLDYFCSRLIVD